jgi:hypothetical protein
VKKKRPNIYAAKDCVIRINGKELRMGKKDTIEVVVKPRCVICRRPLRSKDSIAQNMGKGCARKNPGLALWYRAEWVGQQRLPGLIDKPT